MPTSRSRSVSRSPRKQYLRTIKNDEDLPYFCIKTSVPSPNNLGVGLYKFPKPPSPEIIRKFQARVLIDADILEAPSGFYTWLIKNINGKNVLVAARTRVKQEIGTLHKNLDGMTQHGEVLIAGEMHITAAREYRYNLLSGSYSKGIMKKVGASRNLLLKEHLVSLGVKEEKIDSSAEEILERAELVANEAERGFYTDVCFMVREPYMGMRGGTRKVRR